MIPRRPLLAALGLLLAGCGMAAGGGGATPSPQPSVSGGEGGVRAVSLERLPGAHPVRRSDAAIAIAFAPDTAAALAGDVGEVDFGRQALLCLFIGERSTGGWSVTLQSITLDGSAMAIRAREVRPRPGAAVTQALTYPADCGLIDRSVLPTGELLVRADDTTSDEFIVDATIEVPPR